ncbi:hypothetical protein CC85DRAFT_288399 [Cutaneotrichosporon oleaginosum]|uniref:Uncharacterized protein n=1 Tax=Cutaneotrichosporon oleaginosum TaxID=879819 RepID=A0A0J0XEW4_9TREE|nr:uncharacterized protein CC85DRAFT_288399 [Cutaneotrichosporon oleaginosum]KLT39606.1 hypothetical protein CC85DRAFT_288399 [Cutaneotrichosporon oleaginosum]TXT15466.1 hypothetical protein COLE_01659 [Cutaneotrichosporon oleaginosum]
MSLRARSPPLPPPPPNSPSPPPPYDAPPAYSPAVYTGVLSLPPRLLPFAPEILRVPGGALLPPSPETIVGVIQMMGALSGAHDPETLIDMMGWLEVFVPLIPGAMLNLGIDFFRALAGTEPTQ